MARILIVDDEPSIVLAVRDELLFEGFEVESASDGPTGVQKAREWKPDVLLLDLMLPGMNGYEVCRRLRPEQRCPLLLARPYRPWYAAPSNPGGACLLPSALMSGACTSTAGVQPIAI